MRNRYEQLITLLTSTGYTVNSLSAENNGITIILKMEVMVRPPHDFLDRIREEVEKYHSWCAWEAQVSEWARKMKIVHFFSCSSF